MGMSRMRRALVMGVIGGAGAAAVTETLLIQDTFTAPDATDMGARAPDVAQGSALGATWVELVGAWVITGNKAAKTSEGTDLAVIDAGDADVRITCDIEPNATDASESIAFRLTNNTNYWMARWLNTATQELQLYEINAGVATKRASATLAGAAGTPFSIEIIAIGQTIQVTVGGTVISYSLAVHNDTATKCGLRQSSTVKTGRWDNFTVYARDT